MQRGQVISNFKLKKIEKKTQGNSSNSIVAQFDIARIYFVCIYSDKNFSASSAAIHPVPAAVTACL